MHSSNTPPRRLILATFAALTFVGSAGRAEAKGPVNVDGDGIAIHGYDPVAYFVDEKPTRGTGEFTHRWQGATWRFATADHRNRFAKSPEKYAPRYGGYCAWAVSQGYTADIDPMAWKIVDGRLYLNYSLAIQKKWEAIQAKAIPAADQKWPTIREGLRK